VRIPPMLRLWRVRHFTGGDSDVVRRRARRRMTRRITATHHVGLKIISWRSGAEEFARIAKPAEMGARQTGRLLIDPLLTMTTENRA